MKHQWFRFYPADWLTDDRVIAMSPAARSAYLNLLCHQAINDGLPNDPDALAGMSGLTRDEWAACSERVIRQFERRGGRLFNARLDREVKAVQAAIEQRRAAGAASAAKKTKNLVEGSLECRSNEHPHFGSTYLSLNNNNINGKDLKAFKSLKAYNSILAFWNARDGLQKHQAKGAIWDKIIRAINGRFAEGATEEEICRAIENYSVILNSDKHFWEYRWPLHDFLTRGFVKFRDDARPLDNFRIRKQTKPTSAQESVDSWKEHAGKGDKNANKN